MQSKENDYNKIVSNASIFYRGYNQGREDGYQKAYQVILGAIADSDNKEMIRNLIEKALLINAPKNNVNVNDENNNENNNEN